MPEAFKNIVDYVWEQGDSFETRPLCRVDSLVFSQLSYFQMPTRALEAWGWEGLPLTELWRTDWLDEMVEHMVDPEGAKRLAAALSASPRFRDVRICGYVMQDDQLSEMQFSAMTFRMAGGGAYVAYRGTDNTLLGWKENLNMAFQVQMPSHAQAMRYLERTAAHVDGDLWVGGHSKGGTLATYVGFASSPELRERIVCCYSHDGPGFIAATLEDVDAKSGGAPVDKTVPKSSVFGMLFAQDYQDALVVRSANSGFWQHDPLSWVVEGCDFVLEERLGRTASYVDNSLNAWIQRATFEERECFVDAVFSIMTAGDEKYAHEIRLNWRTALPTMARAARDLDPDQRELLMHKVYELVRELGPGESKEARERADWVSEHAEI